MNSLDLRASRRLNLSARRWVDAVPMTCAAVVLAIAVGVLVTKPSLVQIAILIAVLPLSFSLAMLSPRALIVGLEAWLAVLGTVRRLLPGQGASSLATEVILLVGPIVLVMLFLTVEGKNPRRDRSKLAQAMFLLSLVVVVEAFNPLQGGITVGLGGVLLILVPMLAFWVGRSLLDARTLTRLLRLVAGLALAAATYGIVQVSIGFPPWDTKWINQVQQNYHALNVGGVVRAFGSFSSTQEYAAFLGIGVVAWLAFGLTSRYLPIALVCAVFIGWALVLDSSRGVVVLTVIALGVMIAVRAGLRPAGTIVGGLVAYAILTFVASHLATHASVQGSNSILLAHQFNGIANPLNSKDSTLGFHFSELTAGIKSAFTLPIGHGTGSITVAASKFSGTGANTDVDPSNAGAGLGLPGLILYFVVLIRGIVTSYRVAKRRPDPLSLAVLGLLIVTLFQWLNGGLYSVNWLVWLCLGWVDQRSTADDVSVNEAAIHTRLDKPTAEYLKATVKPTG